MPGAADHPRSEHEYWRSAEQRRREALLFGRGDHTEVLLVQTEQPLFPAAG